MIHIIRNGDVKLEVIELTVDGKGYRVTGYPTIYDKNAMVEVLRPETMHGRGLRDRVRFSHWARITSEKRRQKIRDAALAIEAKP